MLSLEVGENIPTFLAGQRTFLNKVSCFFPSLVVGTQVFVCLLLQIYIKRCDSVASE